MKKISFFLFTAAALLVGIGCSRAAHDFSPIEQSEYVTSTLPVTGYNCLTLSQGLLDRCTAAGGTLQNNVTLSGFAQLRTLGCYPAGTTTDAGNKCVSDAQCEGQCLWLAGDFITPDSSKTCSEHKKPFFAATEQNYGYYLCNVPDSWPDSERVRKR